MPDTSPIRIERTLYPDGSPKEETHYRGPSCHGPWRQWHPNGKLALEFHYDKNIFADGLHRRWFANGRLESELTFRDGTLIKEIAFNAKGKQVPSEYDRILARRRTFITRIAAKAKLAKRKVPAKIDSQDAANSRAFIDSLLATPSAPAREWLRESATSPRSLGEMDTTLSSLFIDILHELGAAQVLAVQIESSPFDSAQTTNHLIIVLPTDSANRARIFAFDRAHAKDLGFESEGDWGQTHLYMLLC